MKFVTSPIPLGNPLGIEFNENIESNKGDYVIVFFF